MRSTLAILRNRNLGLLLLGRIISTGGDWIYQIALMLAIYQYSGGKVYYIGIFWLVRLVPNLVLGPFAGALADRVGYRRAMIGADLQRMVFVVLLALLLHPGTWGIIYPIAFGVVVGSTVFNPANVGLIPSLVHSPSERLAANAAIMQATSLAAILGSAVGGLATGLGYRNLLLIDAATFAVSAACLYLLRPRVQDQPQTEVQPQEPTADGTPEAVQEEPRTGVIAGFRMLGSRPVLVFAAAVMALPELASGAAVVWVVPYAERLHLHAAGAGYLYSALGVGALLGGFVAAALGGSIRLDALLAGSVAAGGAALAVFGVVPIAGIALLGLLVVGLMETVEYAAYETLLQQAVPESAIGQAAGTMNSYLFNMMLIGNVASGFLAAWLGLPVSVGGLGLLILLATGGGWIYLQVRTAGRPNALALGQVPVFAEVPLNVREWAVRRMSREDVAAGSVVIRQGDVGDKFYTIARGTAHVTIEGGEAPVRAQLTRGDFFGEIALLRDVPRTATVSAETPLTLWVLDREDFEELQRRAGEFRESLLETATARLAASPNLQTVIATRS